MSSNWNSTTWNIFSRLRKVAFWAGQEAEYLATTKKNSSRPQPIRILCWSRGRKCFQSHMQAHETSLSPPHPSHILGWSRGT